MNWIKLEHLLLKAQPERAVTANPVLNHAHLCAQALSLAAGLKEQGVQRVAVHFEDAADLAIALLGAWRAGVSVLLPADLQPQTRQRWSSDVDLWLTDLAGDGHLTDYQHPPMPPAELDLDLCRLSVCTSGSSGEPKRIEKTLRQLANEVQALEALWGVDLGEACIISSVATQHIYGLLFRVLWPLCAGRPFVRTQLAFPEDLQRASREQHTFAWVASPALLKRMGDNLDWPALTPVKRVFSSGGALPLEAAGSLHQRRSGHHSKDDRDDHDTLILLNVACNRSPVRLEYPAQVGQKSAPECGAKHGEEQELWQRHTGHACRD